MNNELTVVNKIDFKKRHKIEKYRFEFLLTSRSKKETLKCEGECLIESDDSVDVYAKIGDKVPVLKVSKDVFEAVMSYKIEEK